MCASKQKDLWDVIYILPKGNRRVVYRMVPLHNIDNLIELTREMATTCKSQLQCRDITITTTTTHYYGHTPYIIPGFHLIHEPPSNNNDDNNSNNNNIEMYGESLLLRPDHNSWYSLCQRQGNSTRVVLRLVPFTAYTPHGKRETAQEMSSHNSVEMIKVNNHNRGISEEGNLGNSSQKIVNSPKVELHSTSSTPCSSSSSKLNTRCSNFPSSLIQLRQQMDRESSSLQNKSTKHCYDGDALVDVSVATVRIFALRYVQTQIYAFLSEQVVDNKEKEERKEEKERVPLLTREGIVYFAAAVVKYWQMRLELSTDAMNEIWNSKPPLVRNAQFEYLKNIIFSFWTQFLEVKQNEKKNHEEEVKNNKKVMMMGQKQALSDHQEITKQPSSIYGFSENKIKKTKQIERKIVNIQEVTYCSSIGPLPLPSVNIAGKQLSLSLNSVTSQVDINKEFSITGQVIGVRNPLGLFWWIVESKCNSQTSSEELQDSNETSILLPLDDLYNKSCLITYQVTSQTFVLVIKPETLSSSRSYRIVAEVCDIHTGEIAVNEVKFCTI